MSWQLVGPYHRDPTVALKRAQHQYFRDNYDLPEILDRELAGVNDAIRATESEIARLHRKRKPNPDELKLNEGLLWTYNDTAKRLVKIKKSTLRKTVDGQIELLRHIAAICTWDGLGNILDIKGVSNRIEAWHVWPMPLCDASELFSADRPTQHVVEKLGYRVYSKLDRAESISVTVYRAAKPRRATAIVYFGYSAD